MAKLNWEKTQRILSSPDTPPEQLAAQLDITVKTVLKVLAEHGKKNRPLTGDLDQDDIRRAFRDSIEFKRLREELSPVELKFFEETYVGLVEQFKGDVFHTEHVQIAQAIRFQVLMGRTMIARQDITQQISRLGDMRDNILSKYNGKVDKMSAADNKEYRSFNDQIMELRKQDSDLSSEYVKYQERADKLMQQLKGTRADRIKNIESSKDTFLGLIKKLAERDVQKEEGRFLELLKMAQEKEYARLGRLNRYDDGVFDRPILSPETVQFTDTPEDYEKKDV